MLMQQRSLPSPWLGLVLLLTLGFVAVNHVEAESVEQTTVQYVTPIPVRQINLDKFIDKNVGIIHDALLPLDPVELKDANYSVSSNIYLNLHTGWVQNLSLIKRVGVCTLSFENKILSADLNFGWDDINVDYRYLLKLLFMTKQGDLHILLSQIKINVILDFDFNSYHLILRNLDYTSKGKINVKLEGHVSDKIYNLIIKAITNVGQKMIFNTIKTQVTKALQDSIDDLNEEIDKLHQERFEFVNLIDIDDNNLLPEYNN